MIVDSTLSPPERHFEELWKTYDQNYALFGAKRIDWDLLHAVYRPKVTAKTTDSQLFDILGAMLANLNDYHVALVTTDKPPRVARSGMVSEMNIDDFSLDVIADHYITGNFYAACEGVFTFGWLPDSIGYFHFSRFSDLVASEAAIDTILEKFVGAKGIICDVRLNGGGDDRVGRLIANRFADRRRLYMKTFTRDGPAHDDFTPVKYWYLYPDGPRQFTGPVILLTHRHSVSAAENFALAMRTLPNVTVVGDMTAGVFADVYADTLDNGWSFRVPYKLFVDYNDNCWEGIGVPVDVRQTNTRADLDSGHDRVLALAIDMISSGKVVIKEKAPGSLKDLRLPIATHLEVAIRDLGVEAGPAVTEQTLVLSPDRFYVDADELEALCDGYIYQKRYAEAEAVCRFLIEHFPESYRSYDDLGDVLLQRGDTAAARKEYRVSMSYNRRNYPWEKRTYDYQKRVIDGVRLLADELAHNIDQYGVKEAIRRFRMARRGPVGTFYFTEVEINNLGYSLLYAGKIDDAIEVFKLNVREFPTSWNVYDSLGEAFMKAGKKRQAIENYERSLIINPDNENGRRMLNELNGG